jgi:peroxiredoxin
MRESLNSQPCVPQEGQLAPDIELQGSEGPWRLSAQRGQPVLLVFLRWLG